MPRRLRPDRYATLVVLGQPGYDEYYDREIHSGHPVDAATARKWRQQAQLDARTTHALTTARPNGRNDPQSVALLIDALLHLDKRSFITAGRFAAHLNTFYPQIIWEPVTVGRILHNLAEVSDTYPRPPEQPPFINISTVNGIRNYTPPQYQRASRWLMDMREAIVPILEEYNEALRRDPHLTLSDEDIWERLMYEPPEEGGDNG